MDEDTVERGDVNMWSFALLSNLRNAFLFSM